MVETRVERIEGDAQWDAAVPILRQLWTDADESFVRSWRDDDEYRLFGLYAREDGDEELAAVAGVSVQRVLHHRRHAWIHDFVTDEAWRGEGLGAELLAFVESWAEDRDCEYVALAATLDNEGAVDFYEREGLERFGYVLETEL